MDSASIHRKTRRWRLLALQVDQLLLGRGHGHQGRSPGVDGPQAPGVQAPRLRLVAWVVKTVRGMRVWNRSVGEIPVFFGWVPGFWSHSQVVKPHVAYMFASCWLDWVNSPPLLEPVLVGIGMLTGGYDVWILTHGHLQPRPVFFLAKDGALGKEELPAVQWWKWARGFLKRKVVFQSKNYGSGLPQRESSLPKPCQLS